MEMYIWNIRIEIEYATRWKSHDGGGEEETWTEETNYTVAAPSGLGAIEKAGRLAKEFEPFDNSDEKEKDEPLKTTVFSRVVDVTYLELKETLDG